MQMLPTRSALLALLAPLGLKGACKSFRAPLCLFQVPQVTGPPLGIPQNPRCASGVEGPDRVKAATLTTAGAKRGIFQLQFSAHAILWLAGLAQLAGGAPGWRNRCSSWARGHERP